MRSSSQRANFYSVIQEAVADFAVRGYDSELRLEQWLQRIREAAQADLISAVELDFQLRTSLEQVYSRLVDQGGLLKQHPGADRMILERVRPQLHAELQRRILASANLIKLNRAAAIDATLRRFSGWASGVPAGGAGPRPVRREAAAATRKELTKLGFQTRRVAIDQGHKFAANLSNILAEDGGAIAGVWHQHYTRQPRQTHKARDGKVYLLRNSWAHREGLVKPGPAGYLDEISQPGEEVYCRCSVEYLYGFRRLPADMLTIKGSQRLAEVRAHLAA